MYNVHSVDQALISVQREVHVHATTITQTINELTILSGNLYKSYMYMKMYMYASRTVELRLSNN